MRETIPDEVPSVAGVWCSSTSRRRARIAACGRARSIALSAQSPSALNHFFKVENLASATRETALRQAAEDVEIKRLRKS